MKNNTWKKLKWEQDLVEQEFTFAKCGDFLYKVEFREDLIPRGFTATRVDLTSKLQDLEIGDTFNTLEEAQKACELNSRLQEHKVKRISHARNYVVANKKTGKHEKQITLTGGQARVVKESLPDTHSLLLMPFGGRTRVSLVNKEGKIVYGEGRCINTDRFCKRTGREFAILNAR